jgi:hypothetical protein
MSICIIRCTNNMSKALNSVIKMMKTDYFSCNWGPYQIIFQGTEYTNWYDENKLLKLRPISYFYMSKYLHPPLFLYNSSSRLPIQDTTCIKRAKPSMETPTKSFFMDSLPYLHILLYPTHDLYYSNITWWATFRISIHSLHSLLTTSICINVDILDHMIRCDGGIFLKRRSCSPTSTYQVLWNVVMIQYPPLFLYNSSSRLPIQDTTCIKRAKPSMETPTKSFFMDSLPYLHILLYPTHDLYYSNITWW